MKTRTVLTVFPFIYRPFLRCMIMLAVFLSIQVGAQPIVGKRSPDGVWTTDRNQPASRNGRKPAIPTRSYHTAKVDFAKLRAALSKAPREFTPEAAQKSFLLSLPMPDGSFARFYVEESELLGPELARKYPQIKTYAGRGVDDPTATVRLDITKKGFRAQVLSANGAVYIDPYDVTDTEYCISYEKRSVVREGEFSCVADVEPVVAIKEVAPQTEKPEIEETPATAGDVSHGSTRRTYRLVVAATGQYTSFHGGTVEDGVAAIVTTVNRVTGIYERELSMRLTLVDTMVYTDGSTDPFNEGDPDQVIDANQQLWDSYGSSLYDIGHVFGVNISSQAVMGVCQPGIKAKGTTGRGVAAGGPINDPYDVDYVAHEIGHQFGASHTFNSTAGGCSGNRVGSTAYEPGSGSTIMAYAGLCSNSSVNDDLQSNSDPFFHSASLEQIRNYITPGVGLGDCPTAYSTGNSIPTVNAGPNRTIPGWTPFALQATGSDPDGDLLSYSWEQRDLGPAQSLAAGDNGESPLFRFVLPSMDGKRVFPRFAEQGTNVAFGDRIPVVDRTMVFRVTGRDQRGWGAFDTDDVVLTVEASAGPFYIQSPNESSVTWESGSYQSVEWEVNGTDVSPINCSSVQILLSTDDGLTYPYQVTSSTPNDGYEERLFVPTIPATSTKCRLMVKAVGNIFFDVSDEPFTVTAPTPPANDNKASAEALLISATGHVSGNNINATKESGEPMHWHNNSGNLYTGGRSVWYSWYAVQGGVATFSLSSTSQVFSVVSVYESGSDWNGLKTPALATAQGGGGTTFQARKDKLYYIVVDGLHDQDFGHFGLEWSMVIDSTPPVVGFSPLTNQTPIFDFAELGGSVNESSTVQFVIEEFNPGGVNRYWDGTQWTSTITGRLNATMNGNNWTPASGTLPSRGQTRQGNYLVYAYATDLAGNQGESNIVLSRTPQDTTPPVVTVNITEDQVFTNNFLPQILGFALDDESGVDLVTVYLMRPADGGHEYWTGNAWTTTGTALTMHYEQFTWSFPAGMSQPSGTNLRNDTYTIQISARNREVPQITQTITVNFTVDYHPVFTWTEGSFSDSNPDNNNYLWENPANWDIGTVPPTNAVVVITGGQPDSRPMGSINIYGVNLSGGTLRTAGMFVRKLNVHGGSLVGGAVTLEPLKGNFNWTAGYLEGSYTFPTGSTANLSGAGNKQLASFAVVNNSGTVNWSGPGPIYTYAYNSGDFSTFNNLSNGVFNVLTDGTPFVYTHNPSYFYNQAGALFNKTGGSGTNHVHSFYFHNRGETRAETGTIVFQGTMFLEDGSVFSGDGTFRFQLASAEVRGTTTVDKATFFVESGTFIGNPASLLRTTNGGAFEWTGGTFAGEVELASDSTLRISGTNYKSLNNFARLRNHGDIIWSDSGDIYTYAYSAGDYSSIDNYSGSTFTVTGNANFTFTHNPSYFTVHPGASLQKTSGGGVTRSDWFFNNNGDVAVQSGSLNLNWGGSSNGKFSVGLGASVKYTAGQHAWNNGTQLHGAGKIQIDGGTVTRNGTISSADASQATLELFNGTLNGTGSLTGNLQVNWYSGAVGGLLDVASSVTFEVIGNGTKSLNASSVLNNAGTFNWNSSGILHTYAYSAGEFATFNNLSNAVFNLQTDGDLFGITYNRSFFTNHTGALFIKSAGTGTNLIDEFGFENFGEIRIETGTIRFNDIARIGPGSLLTGAGYLQVNGNVLLDTALTSTATISHLGGTVTCTTNAAYFGTAPYNWTGGAIGGRLKLEPTATMNISGEANKSLNNFAVLENFGTVNWTGPGRIYTYAYNSGDFAAFNNHSNATFNIKSDGQVFEITHNRSFFTNQVGGLILKSEGTGTNQVHSYHLQNYGEIQVDTGAVQFLDVVHLDHGSRFSGSGTVRLVGNVTLNGNLDATCNVSLDGGILTGVVSSNGIPSYSGTGPFTWQQGTIAGSLDIQNGSTMHLVGPANKSLNNFAELNNYGVMNWSGPGRIYTYAYSPGDASRLNNHAVFNVLTDGTLFEITHNQSFFTNHTTGLFTKLAGTNSTHLHSFLFANRGEVKVSAGTLENHGQLQLENASRVTGTGTLLQSAGETRLRGALTLSEATLRIAGGSLHNENFGHAPSVTTGNGGLMEWAGGGFHGNFTLAAGSRMNLTGATKEFGGAASFNNHGQISWSSGNIHCYAYYWTDRSTIYNRSGAIFEAAGGPAFTYVHNASAFVNEPGAVFRKIGSGSTRSDWYFENGGTLDLQAGVLELPVGPTLSAVGNLQFLLSGTNATDYGRLALPPGTALQGNLSASVSTNYAPAHGDLFTLVTYQNRTGEFTLGTLPALPNPLQWSTIYGPAALTLAVERAHLLENGSTMEGGQFRLDFSGPAASSAILEASTNLVNWTGILTNSPFTGSAQLVDPEAALHTNRFYRVVILP